MLNNKDMRIVLAFSGTRIFILAMMYRGHLLCDIAHTLGVNASYITDEKNRIEKLFKEAVFYREKRGEGGRVFLTEYGMKIGKICNRFLNVVFPNLGDVSKKPHKERYESWEA